ncbi:MAG: hypothetical protein IJ218_03700 [Alphaproteobacteria bacterium]|nr:hypothetical protein [Alphaproteobacteria bacterium]
MLRFLKLMLLIMALFFVLETLQHSRPVEGKWSAAIRQLEREFLTTTQLMFNYGTDGVRREMQRYIEDLE